MCLFTCARACVKFFSQCVVYYVLVFATMLFLVPLFVFLVPLFVSVQRRDFGNKFHTSHSLNIRCA